GRTLLAGQYVQYYPMGMAWYPCNSSAIGGLRSTKVTRHPFNIESEPDHIRV
ncbi:hypothetical protein L195_g036736, partial [Trifolium pratense]